MKSMGYPFLSSMLYFFHAYESSLDFFYKIKLWKENNCVVLYSLPL